MGVGNLAIGAGIGDASVFNPNPAIQQYGQIVAQRQAKHQAEVKQLGDELAKGYDPSGLRNDADRSSYIKQYNDVKDFAIDAENEKDSTKKALKLAQVRQKLNDLGAFSEGSKKYAQLEQGIAKEHALNQWAVDDNTAKRLLAQRDKPWNDPNNIQGWGDVVRGVDPNKMETEYQKINDGLIKHHPATYGTETITNGQDVFGHKTATGVSNRVIPYQDALEMHLHAATANLDYQKYLNDKYQQLQDPDPQKQLALRVAQDMADHGDSQGIYDKPKVQNYKQGETPAEKMAYHVATRTYDINHPMPNTLIGNQPTPAQTLAINMQKGVPGSGDKFASLTPTGQYGTNKPIIDVDAKTGVQKIHFPDQIDEKAIQQNKEMLAEWKKSNGDAPYEAGNGWKPLKQEVKKPSKTYELDPNSSDYISQWSQMAKEQNVNLAQLNQIEGVKGGHGQVDAASYSNVTSGKDKKGNSITIGYKNGKWYDVKSHKPFD